MANGDGDVSADTQKLLSGLGITGEDIALAMTLSGGGGGGGSDWDSMKVYKGTKKVQKPGGMEPLQIGGLLPKFPKVIPPSEYDEDDTDIVGNLKKDVYRKPPGEVTDLQRRLWEAGMYDPSYDWDDIQHGNYDDQTSEAWERAVRRAAAFYDVGKKLTVDEVIEMSRQGMSDEERLSGSRKRGRAGPTTPLSLRLTHPDDIKTTAMKVSASTLGRGWNEDQLSRFVATFQAMERASQAAAHNAQQVGGTSTAPPDMAVAAEKEARRQDPVAAGATDYVDAYNMVLKAFQTLGAGAGG